MVDRKPVFGIRKDLKRVCFVSWLAMLLILADAFTTKIIILKGGIELNPLVNLLYHNLNILSVELYVMHNVLLAIIIGAFPFVFIAIEILKNDPVLDEDVKDILSRVNSVAYYTIVFVAVIRSIALINNVVIMYGT